MLPKLVEIMGRIAKRYLSYGVRDGLFEDFPVRETVKDPGSWRDETTPQLLR